jgi:hypothetical protein
MKFIGWVGIILLCYAGMLLGGSPVGPPELVPKYASWAVTSHHDEILRNLSKQLLTVDDGDTAIWMLAVIKASKDIEQEHRVQIVESLAESITALGSTLGESKNPSVARLADRYVRYALECMIDLDPEAFVIFPARIGKAKLKPSWAATLIREYLACLWTVDAQNVTMGQSALKDLKVSAGEDTRVVNDIKLRFRLISTNDQKSVWRILFSEKRPSTIKEALNSGAGNRVEANRWLNAIDRKGSHLDPLIPLKMGKALPDEDIAGKYTLLDWACRAWNGNLSRKQKDEAFTNEAKQIISEVDNFYRQHGGSIKKAVAGNHENLLDYLQETAAPMRKHLAESDK